MQKSFNPRARAGRDTLRFQPLIDHLFQFQSTRPRGARRDVDTIVMSAAEFQSTRPRGARLAWVVAPLCALCSFNPRARAGRDQKYMQAHTGLELVSIHAPARGAT